MRNAFPFRTHDTGLAFPCTIFVLSQKWRREGLEIMKIVRQFFIPLFPLGGDGNIHLVRNRAKTIRLVLLWAGVSFLLSRSENCANSVTECAKQTYLLRVLVTVQRWRKTENEAMLIISTCNEHVTRRINVHSAAARCERRLWPYFLLFSFLTRVNGIIIPMGVFSASFWFISVRLCFEARTRIKNSCAFLK